MPLFQIVHLILISILYHQLICSPIAFFPLSYPTMKAKVYMSYFDLRQHNIDDLIKDFNDRLTDHTRKQARIQESSYEKYRSAEIWAIF